MWGLGVLLHCREEFLKGRAVHGGNEICEVWRTAGRLCLRWRYLLKGGLRVLSSTICRSLRIPWRAWCEMCGLCSEDKFCGYIRIELVILFEEDIVYSPPTIEDLKRYLARNLRLTEYLHNGLHPFKYLSLDHSVEWHPTRQLEDTTTKATVTK